LQGYIITPWQIKLIYRQFNRNPDASTAAELIQQQMASSLNGFTRIQRHCSICTVCHVWRSTAVCTVVYTAELSHVVTRHHLQLHQYIGVQAAADRFAEHSSEPANSGEECYMRYAGAPISIMLLKSSRDSTSETTIDCRTGDTDTC